MSLRFICHKWFCCAMLPHILMLVSKIKLQYGNMFLMHPNLLWPSCSVASPPVATEDKLPAPNRRILTQFERHKGYKMSYFLKKKVPPPENVPSVDH